MALSKEFRVTSELFLVEHEDLLILYAPLRGVVAAVNAVTAALLRDLQAGKEFELSADELDVLRPLTEAGIINGPGDMPLTIHEQGRFCPTHVTLFLTDACNLRCLYCYARGGDNPQPVVLPSEIGRAGIDFVVDNALKSGQQAFSVGFHGAGEPTVAWDRLVEMVEYANRRAAETGLTVSCATCTNAVMSEEHARWLAAHTQTATVSVDGLSEFHDRQRPLAGGGGSFEIVRRTLNLFDELGFFYAIRATITQWNVHTMAEMVEFFDDNFHVGDLQFDPLICSGRCLDTGIPGPGDEEYLRQYIRAYDAARARGRMVGFSCLSFTALKSFYCCAVSDGFAVTHEGLVTACFEACGLGHPHADRFIYGRYDPQTRTFDLDLEKVRRLQTRHVHNLPYCRNCFCKYMCAGDCPMHSLKMGYRMERGTRCRITQDVARHRLAQVVRTGTPPQPKLQETVNG